MIQYFSDGPLVMERWSRKCVDGGKQHESVYCVAVREADAFVIVDLLNDAVKRRAYPFQADVRADPTREES